MDDIIKNYGLEGLGRYYSVYPAEVADIRDPEKRGRIKVRSKPLWDNDTHDYWAEPFGMMNTGGQGDFFIPAVGDRVWVQFTNGDQRFPVWSYAINKESIANLYDNAGNPVGKVVQTAKHRLELNDSTNKTVITLTDGGTMRVGAADAAIPVAKGDTVQSILSDLIDILVTIQVDPGTHIILPTITAQLNSLKSTLATLKSSQQFVKA